MKSKTPISLSSRFVRLGWFILEAKYEYYRLNKPSLEDFQYDALEDEYKELAGLMGEDTSASDMVGFDAKRPSCQMVISGYTMRGETVLQRYKRLKIEDKHRTTLGEVDITELI